MGQTKQLKTRTICWDESVTPVQTRPESELGRSESRKQRTKRLKYLIGEKAANSPYAQQDRVVLAPFVREIRPIGRQLTPCNHRSANSYSNAISGWKTGTKGDKCANITGSLSGKATTEKNQTCLFCRMESPSGVEHNSWCRKFFSLTEIYSQYNSTVSSRMRQRKMQSDVSRPATPVRPLLDQYCRDLRFLPRRAGPSPSTPPPPPTPADPSLIRPQMIRNRGCQATEITKISQMVEYRFTDQPNASEEPTFLRTLDNFSTEGSMFKPHLSSKHRQITVSPAIGKEFVVEKLGLKLRMPHPNKNWSKTAPKRAWRPKPFLSQRGCTLPPMVFRGPSNMYLHCHQFVEEYAVNKRLSLSGKQRLYEITKFAEREKLSRTDSPKPDVTDNGSDHIFESEACFDSVSNNTGIDSLEAKNDFDEIVKTMKMENTIET